LARIGPAAQQAVLPLRQLLKLEAKAHGPNFFRMPPELDIPLGAACALLRILPGDDQALSVIKTSLRSSDKNLRRLALEACAQTKVREKALVEDFIKALQEKELQEAAANALAEIGPDAEEAVPVLLEILMNERSNHSHEHEAARALVAIGKAALPALVKVATRRDAPARYAALLALSQFDTELKQIMPILMQALADEDARLIAAIALGKLGSKARKAGAALFASYLVDFLGTDEELLCLELWALRQVIPAVFARA
jgi:HEAT repeat protein